MQLLTLLGAVLLSTFISANPVEDVGALIRSPNIARELVVNLTGRDHASIITYPRMKAESPMQSDFSGMTKRAILGLRQTCFTLYCPDTGLCCDSPFAVDCCGLFCTLPGQVCCQDGAICGAGQQCCGEYCAPTGNQCCGDGSTNCNTGLLCVLVEGIQRCCENVDCSAGGATATSIATISTDVPGSTVSSAAPTATTAIETTAAPVPITQITASSSASIATHTSTPATVTVTKHSNATAIGAGVGVPVTLLLLAAIGFFFYRKGKKSAQTQRPQFEPEVTMVPSVEPGKPQEPPSPMSPMSPAPPQYSQATRAPYFNPGNPPEMPSPQQQPQQFYSHHPNMVPSSPQQLSYNQHPEMGPSPPQHFYIQHAEIGSSSLPQQPPSQQGRDELPSPDLKHPSPHVELDSPPLVQRKAVPGTHSELQ